MTASPVLISLCMIVKNEEKNIACSLESVTGIVDELVIVDTGSEDKTVQIAKEYGAQIYYLPWKKDFSAARNYMLSKATGQWILLLDADESLGKINAYDFRQSLQAAKEEGFYLEIINYQGNEGDFLRTYGLRLFRNNYLYFYEGKIHEQILPSIKRANPQALISWSPLTIHHYGYLAGQFREKDKAVRNLEILLSESPLVKKTAFYCLNIAMEYLRLGKLAEAEAKLKEGWKKVNRQESYAHRLLLKLIACLHWQKKNREATEFCALGIKLYPDYFDLYYYYGICLIKIGDLANARNILLAGLSSRESDRSKKYISQAGCGSYLNYYALGQIEEQSSNYRLALDYYLEALRLQPENLKFLKGLIRVCKRLLMLEKYPEALENLKKIPPNSALKKEGLFYCWVGAVLQDNYELSKKYLEQLNILDMRLNNLLTEIENLLQGDFKANNDQYQGYRNNEDILSLLSMMEIFAACKAEKLLEKIIKLLLVLAGEELKPLLIKVLYQQKCYPQALQILASIDKEQMDEEMKSIKEALPHEFNLT